MELPPRRRCAGAPTARARATGAGSGRCAPRSSDSPRASTRVTETRFAGLPGSPDPWAARDAYVDVVLGVEAADAFARRWLSGDGSGRRSAPGGARSIDLPRAHGGPALAAGDVQQRRLVLGRPDAAGDGGGPARRGPGGPDRRRAGRCRARAPAGGRPRAVQLAGPRIDGATIYGRALAAVGQPGVEDPA